ncbi:hypothetical protein [Baekduia sp. Peel2402]
MDADDRGGHDRPREYKRTGAWRIVHPKVWVAAQDALAARRKR